MVLEQLKNSVPERVATYITEHKVKTLRDAAVLADEYVLTHRSFCDTTGAAGHRNDTYSRPVKIKTANEADRQKFTQGGWSSVVNSDTCRYCQARGHWKEECPVLKARRLTEWGFQ